MAATVLHSATVIDAAGTRHDAWVAMAEGRVSQVGTGGDWRTIEGARAIDLAGATIIPGAVDIHQHGATSLDWGRASVAEMARVVEAHRRLGTTSLVASLATDDWDRMLSALARIREVRSQYPELWGAHLEGPFLSTARRGAHAEQLLQEPSPDLVAAVADHADVLCQVTVAPELYGALEAIERWVDAGIVVALGHTEATATVCDEAFARGASMVTHAFNGMRPIAARDVGPVGSALRHPHVTLEVIGDGVHVDRNVMAMLFAAAPGRVALVSDALPALGMPEGEYQLAGTPVTVAQDRATVSGTDTIAGSVRPVLAGVGRVIEAGVAPHEAVAAATTVPAAALGKDPYRHRLVAGAPAHLLVVDSQWELTDVVAAPYLNTMVR